MLQETWFAMDPICVVGPIILACAILYAIPAIAVLGEIPVTGFGMRHLLPASALVELGSPPEIISLFPGAMTWRRLYAHPILVSGLFRRQTTR